MKRTVLSLCTLLALVIGGCSDAGKSRPTLAAERPKHVIVVGFDGLSAEIITRGANMPTLRKLMADGASTLLHRSVLPSSSAINWASMFMGAGPELHGYTEWGSRTPELPSRVVNQDNRFPNIFGLYRDKFPQAEIGYIHEWDGLNYLVDTLAMSYRCHAPASIENDDITRAAVQYITEKRPNLCVVLYDQPDITGHKHGWTSEQYFAMAHHLDSCLARIVGAVTQAGMLSETVLMVVSDHGGIDMGHGGKTLSEVQTPLVLYGKGVKKGFVIPQSTVIYDVAGTLAYLLGVEQPQAWTARPITSAFN